MGMKWKTGQMWLAEGKKKKKKAVINIENESPWG